MIKKTNIIFLYDQNFRTHAGNFQTHARNLYQSGNFQTHAVKFQTHAENFEQSLKLWASGRIAGYGRTSRLLDRIGIYKIYIYIYIYGHHDSVKNQKQEVGGIFSSWRICLAGRLVIGCWWEEEVGGRAASVFIPAVHPETYRWASGWISWCVLEVVFWIVLEVVFW